jgi:serine O-acetyltransferase
MSSRAVSRLRNRARAALGEMQRDVASVVERDPAARNGFEVALLYPGVHAVWVHRVSHALWRHGALLPARALSQTARLVTGIEIHPAATVGPGLFIDHGAGVVIGETAVVGCDVTLYHGVTLGGTSLRSGKRHPTIGDRVTVGAGAKILGPVTVGSDSRVGANAVLVRSVDSHSVVVGVPGQVIAHGTPDEVDTLPKQDGPTAPDPVGAAVASLLERMTHIESRVLGEEPRSQGGPRRMATGDWQFSEQTADFSI